MRARTLDRLVQAHAERAPNAPCVNYGRELLTYGELNDRADQIARKLALRGVGPGHRVALFATKSPQAIAVLLGILKSGAAYVPIDPSMPPGRARSIVEHCGIELVFIHGKPLANLARDASTEAWIKVLIGAESAACATEALTFDAFVSGDAPAVSQAPTGADPAYILYTSGSTGKPKGVAITHAQSLAFVDPAAALFELSANDVVASHAPFSFDLSIIDLFCTFAAGAQVVLIPEVLVPHPNKITRLVADRGITVWNSVPTALVQWARHGQLDQIDLSKLRLIMFAGERFPNPELRALMKLIPNARYLNVYGQTEANSSLAYELRAPPDSDTYSLPLGKNIPNYRVLLIDDDGKLITTPGVRGEMYVSGPAVALGYWDDAERSSQAFVQNPLHQHHRDIVYRTGDSATLDADGNYLFFGRKDSLVKVRGFRVELGEIEHVASAHPELAEVAVLASPDQEAGNILVLCASPKENTTLQEDSVRAHLAAHLTPYMIPSIILSLPALPHTATGKIDRRALQATADDAAQRAKRG